MRHSAFSIPEERIKPLDNYIGNVSAISNPNLTTYETEYDPKTGMYFLANVKFRFAFPKSNKDAAKMQGSTTDNMATSIDEVTFSMAEDISNWISITCKGNER